MGIAYEYVESDDLLVVVWHGPVSGTEWAAFARQRIADDPSSPTGTRLIADITTVDPSSLNPKDVETIVTMFQERAHNLAGVKLAIIAADGWPIAVEFEHHIDRLGSTTIVFNDVDGACGWLGVDPSSTRTVIRTLRTGLSQPR